MSRPILLADLRELEFRINRRLDALAERIGGRRVGYGLCPTCASPYRDERRNVLELLSSKMGKCTDRWHEEKPR